MEINIDDHSYHTGTDRKKVRKLVLRLPIFGLLFFLELRILTAIVFSPALSIIACFLIVIIALIALSMIGAYWTPRMQVILLKRTAGDPVPQENILSEVFIPPFLMSGAAILISAWLIAIGFSERFYEKFHHYNGFKWGEAAWFSLIVLIPVMLFYLLQAINVYRELPKYPRRKLDL